MMTTDELATAVLAMVRKRDHVSFAELAREWPEHFRDGPLEIRSSVAPNLVIWVGLSEAGADALEQMKIARSRMSRRARRWSISSTAARSTIR